MILIGIDERGQAQDALALGQLLSRATGEELLPAWVHPYARLPSVVREGEHEQAVRDALESLFASVRETLPRELRPELRLVPSRSSAAGLQALAERERVSLVVVGASERARIGGVTPGGTAQRLLSGSPAPVAVAPRGYAQRSNALRRIGLGYDGAMEARRALGWAASLARQSRTPLRVVAVHHPPAFPHVSASGAFPVESVNQALRRELREDMDRDVEELGDGLDVQASIFTGDPAAVLAEQSKELDLLVLGSRGYGPVRAVLLGSVSSAIIAESSCPVAVVPRETGEDEAPEPDDS